MAENAESRFERLSARLLADPAVTAGTGFGATPGLRVGGKIFAMLVHGDLVVKLPRSRVDQLVESGAASRFDPGHGRLMKEWAALNPHSGADWDQLAADAKSFVRAGSRR